jgi:predicted nucleic acid-binding protein
MRVFLDANILFSASFPKSHLAQFLGELQCHAVLLTNAYAKAEAARNIAVKQPKRIAVHEKFAASLELVPLQLFDPGVKLAEKDQPILCGAIAGSADFLLTGDRKDFGHLFGTTVRGVKIVNVQMLLAELIACGIVSESVPVSETPNVLETEPVEPATPLAPGKPKITKLRG